MIFSPGSRLSSPFPPAVGSSCLDPAHDATASSFSSPNELHKGPPAFSLNPVLIGPLLHCNPPWGSIFFGNLWESSRNFLESILGPSKLPFRSQPLSLPLFFCPLLPPPRMTHPSPSTHCHGQLSTLSLCFLPSGFPTLSLGDVAILPAFKTWLQCPLIPEVSLRLHPHHGI